MSTYKDLSFDCKGVGNFLSNNQINVPKYQRAFAWTDKHIEDLLDDIQTALAEGRTYFIGTIVLKNENGKLEIVDGQQRLASITILLSAIRNLFLDEKMYDNTQTIDNEFLFTRNRRTNEINPNLTLSIIDNTFFENLILKRKADKSRIIDTEKDSHRRIENAFNISEQFIKMLLQNNSIEKIHDWVDYIDTSLKFIVVTVSSTSNAYEIFETLNDRGIELAQTDLIKNFLFGRASQTKLEQVQEYWLKMIGKIESAESEKLILMYIRHYWSSIHGLTRDSQLFNSIKANVRSHNETVSLAKNLEKVSDKYVAILNPDHSFWKDYNPQIIEDLRTLLNLKLIQFRPLLLSALNKFSKKDIEKTVKLIVSWSVRNLITGKLGGGVLEKEFSGKAKDISDGKIINAIKLKKSLEKIIPGDIEFKEKFEIATVSKSFLARYYLSAIEEQMRGTRGDSLVVNKNARKVNLEHILPQNPDNFSSDWPDFNQETKDEFCFRLGNLTLLRSTLNKKLGNGPYVNKSVEYKKSDLIITNKIPTEYTNWDVVSIKKRQKQLAKIAVKVWSLKI